MSASEAVVRLDLARVAYGDVVALTGVQLAVAPGEIVGLAGHVGAGKTTLALAAAGLLGGAVPARVDGRVEHARLDQPRAAFVFANPWTQLTELGGTVEEEVAVGPENRGLPSQEIRRHVDRALELVGASHLATRAPYELSGGELQRVALASALALDAPLLVLDEPTAQLDPDATRELAARLRALADAGLAVLVVEQNLDVLLDVADRLLVLADGRVLAEGGARELLHTDEPIDPRLGQPASLVRQGEERARPLGSGANALDVTDLVAAYDGRVVLDGLDTRVADGEVVAWTGRNGAGKSTLARTVMGLVRHRRGSITVAGLSMTELDVEERARYVGLVFQDPGRQLFARTVLDEARFAPRVQGCTIAEADARAGEALDVLGLASHTHRHPADLTPQAQRRLAIAATLAAGPRLLILDEPTAGQDAEGRAHIARALAYQRGRGGSALITHELSFARRIADREVTISGGRASSIEVPEARGAGSPLNGS